MPVNTEEFLERHRPGSVGWRREHTFSGTSHGAELWSDGSSQRLIVKHHPDLPFESLRLIAARVDALRAAGVLAPATFAAGNGREAVLIQEYLPGGCVIPLSLERVEQLLAIIELEAGLADESSSDWTKLIVGSLTSGLAGYCEHSSLRTFNGASRDLLARIEVAGRDAATTELPAPDLVHFDLHPYNVLSVGEDRVSGIVDWDGVRAGDRAFDIGVLAFVSSWTEIDATVLHRLWAAFLDTSTHPARVLYMHHIALRFADWIIRHDLAPGADRILDLAHWALSSTEEAGFSAPPT